MVDFQLLDLVSQGAAVEKLLAGMSGKEKLSWLAAHGQVDETQTRKVHPEQRQVYRFESIVNLTVQFFLDGDSIVFIGDHHTFTAREK